MTKSQQAAKEIVQWMVAQAGEPTPPEEKLQWVEAEIRFIIEKHFVLKH